MEERSVSNPVVPTFVHEANAEKAQAEAEQARAAARLADLQAQQVRIELDESDMRLTREYYKRDKELAGDEYHHVYRFLGDVGSASVKACIEQLQMWDRLDPKCDITIVFHSPGGDVVAGMALWDFLTEIKERHHLTTVARGYAASMAGILLQAGHVRQMGKEAWLLIHEASFGVMGSMGEVEDRVDWVRKVQGRILDIFTERSKLSRLQIRKRWARRDWWISSDEALKWGFVDEIA